MKLRAMTSVKSAEARGRSKRLESEVQGLQTKEGIIDEAHKQGLVSGGEESARVEGLDKEGRGIPFSPDYPWYIKVGDFCFFWIYAR